MNKELREKIYNFFKKDTTLKIISTLIAILIWFFVLTDSNPKKEKTVYLSYKVDQQSIVADTDEYTIKNVKEVSGPVSVRISGRSKILANTSENDFKVSLDFSKVTKPGINNVPIKVETNKVGINIDSYSPKEISVNFEEIVDKSFKVVVDVSGSAIRNGYQLLETTVIPETVPMRDFKSVVDKVASVRVSIGSEDVGEPIGNSKVIRKICKFYDQNGKEITNIEKNEFVDVTVRVGKRVPLKYNIVGDPANNYYVNESSINPSSILIYGEPAILDGINELNTEDINISGASEDVTSKVDIVIPQGVNLYGSITPEVTVDIKEFARKTINISNTDLILEGANESLYEYRIQNATYAIVISGREENVNKISSKDLAPTINVDNLSLGSHTLPITLNLPNNVIVVNGTAYATVDITSKPTEEPTQTPTNTPSITPTPTPDGEDNPGNNDDSEEVGGDVEPTED